jgi:hypothetical protein
MAPHHETPAAAGASRFGMSRSIASASAASENSIVAEIRDGMAGGGAGSKLAGGFSAACPGNTNDPAARTAPHSPALRFNRLERNLTRIVKRQSARIYLPFFLQFVSRIRGGLQGLHLLAVSRRRSRQKPCRCARTCQRRARISVDHLIT